MQSLAMVGWLLGIASLAAGETCPSIRVTAAESGLPIPSALVSIAVDKTVVAEAETDSDGHAQARTLAPGTYRIQVLSRGYRDLLEKRRWTFKPPDQCSLAISLTRTGAISGSIFTEEGQAVASVLVGAFVQINTGAGARMAQTAGPPIVTDDRGAYRIYDLLPGRYAVAVLPAPDATPEILLPVFYPGTVEPGRAQFLDLRAGEERTEVNFAVAATETHRLQGFVSGIPSSWNGEHAELVLSTRGEVRTVIASAATDASGHFQFPSVPLGDYQLNAFGPASAWTEEGHVMGMNARTGAGRVSVGGADQEIEIELRDLPKIDGRFVFRDGASAAACGAMDHIALHPEDGWLDVLTPSIRLRNDHFSAEAVPAGHYKLDLPDLQEPCRIDQVLLGNREAPFGIVLLDGSTPVTLVITQNQLKGKP